MVAVVIMENHQAQSARLINRRAIIRIIDKLRLIRSLFFSTRVKYSYLTISVHKIKEYLKIQFKNNYT